MAVMLVKSVVRYLKWDLHWSAFHDPWSSKDLVKRVVSIRCYDKWVCGEGSGILQPSLTTVTHNNTGTLTCVVTHPYRHAQIFHLEILLGEGGTKS